MAEEAGGYTGLEFVGATGRGVGLEEEMAQTETRQCLAPLPS